MKKIFHSFLGVHFTYRERCTQPTSRLISSELLKNVRGSFNSVRSVVKRTFFSFPTVLFIQERPNVNILEHCSRTLVKF